MTRTLASLLAALALTALLAGCRGPREPPPRGVTVADLCGLLERQGADAAEMRDQAIAAFETAGQDFERARKFAAGTAGQEDMPGKYSKAERSGWQNAFAGAAWCRAAEMLHGEALATAELLRDPELAAAIARRVITDCSRDMHSTLLSNDPSAEQLFITAARQISADKAALEQTLASRCHLLETK